MSDTSAIKNSNNEIDGLVTNSLLVDNAPVSETVEIVSISIHQEINKITSATIIIVDGDPAEEDFKISSSKQFLPGKKIEISLGYSSKNVTTFSGIIVSNSHKTNDNCTTLTLECKDEAIKMTLDKNSSHYDKPTSATEIAENFIDKYGLSFNSRKITPSTLKHKQLVQFNSSDWDFMLSKLDAANLMCILNNGEIIIKEIEAESKNKDLVELKFGENILEFDGDLDSRTQSEQVKVVTWNFTNQEVENSDEESESTDGLGKGQKTTIRTSGKKEPEELKKLAENKLSRQKLAKINGSVKYFGKVENPVLPGDFIRLKGLGDNFNKEIFVSAINHDYSDGDWTTTATLGWDVKYFSEQINPSSETSSSGELAAVQGLQIGIVTDIVDADGDFRVKIRLPMVDNQQDGVYARLATLDAGNNRGTFFMPEVGDEVIVGFMNNDPSQPVILGMLHSSKNSAPLDPETANDKKGYVSRSEIKIIIDDGEKSITIETPGGNVFTMNDTENKITLVDSNNNKITMEQSGVTIESATVLTLKAGTSLAISAPQLSMKADGELKLEGGGSTTLKSSGMMTIQGSMVSIN